MNKLSDQPLPDHMRHNQVLTLYLASGRLQTQKEVLVFDLLDLIGNVGGFLGLFLGASIMTMFDEGKMLAERFLCKR